MGPFRRHAGHDRAASTRLNGVVAATRMARKPPVSKVAINRKKRHQTRGAS